MYVRTAVLASAALTLSTAAAAQELRFSELVARNDGAFRTAAGDAPDYVELEATAAVDFGAYYICDCTEFERAARLGDHGALVAAAGGAAGRYVWAADGSRGDAPVSPSSSPAAARP